MLPDRFSDELSRPLLDRNDLNDARKIPTLAGLAMGQLGEIWQRTVAGWHVARHQIQLDYLKTLGVTTLRISISCNNYLSVAK